MIVILVLIVGLARAPAAWAAAQPLFQRVAGSEGPPDVIYLCDDDYYSF